MARSWSRREIFGPQDVPVRVPCCDARWDEDARAARAAVMEAIEQVLEERGGKGHDAPEGSESDDLPAQALPSVSARVRHSTQQRAQRREGG